MKAVSAHTASSMLQFFQVLTGMLIWGTIGYAVIFFTLNTPMDDGQSGLLADSDETVQSANAAESAIIPAGLSSSWMQNASLARGWYVHVGSYDSKVQSEVERLKYARLQEPIQVEVGEDELTHLLVGPYSSKNEAIATNERISSEFRVSPAAIHQIGDVGDAVQEKTTTGDQVTVKSSPTPMPPTSPKIQTEMPPPEPTTPAGNWYIQIGAFKNIEYARNLSKQARSKNYPIRIENSAEGYVRVLLGPYPTQDSATKSVPAVVNALTLGTVMVREIKG